MNSDEPQDRRLTGLEIGLRVLLSMTALAFLLLEAGFILLLSGPGTHRDWQWLLLPVGLPAVWALFAVLAAVRVRSTVGPIVAFLSSCGWFALAGFFFPPLAIMGIAMLSTTGFLVLQRRG